MELPPSWFVKASAIWGECLQGRTIRKVMGGGGGWGMGKKTKKKFMQGKMPRKKIRAKKKGKKKINAEGRSNCDFYFSI